MATAWHQETEENVNYTKLCRLLYDRGTLAVKTVFDGIVPPASLSAKLATDQHKLLKLKKPIGHVLSQGQWNQLYPPSGTCPKSEDFDITLLFVLLRNICGLTPPATGWDALPLPTDTSLEANLVRIKYYRNNVAAHTSKAEVDETLFETYWSDISGALVSLGVKQDDIDELKSSPLGAKDYNELVEYWYLSDEDIKHQLETIKTGNLQIKADTVDIKTATSKIESDTSQIKTDMSKIESDTSQIKRTTTNIESDASEIKSKLCEMESRIHNMTLADELIDKLEYVDYTGLIKKNCTLYHPGTRQWILDEVEENVKKPEGNKASVVLIRAGAGMGKSIVAAKICEIYNECKLLGGCHFFQHSNSLRNNPRIMLQSIARQLCSSVTGYKTALEKKLITLQGKSMSELNCEELFGLLFEEPLSQIRMDNNVAIVIDALDECSSQFKNEFEDALVRKVSDLPSWIRFVITTRPLPSCDRLSGAVQIEISPADSKNEEDLETFFTDELTKRDAKHRIEELMEISKGLFLIAFFVLDILDQGQNSPQTEIAFLTHGISSVYELYFMRIQNLIKPYINTSEWGNDSFFNALAAVVASENPVPKEMFYEIMALKSVNEVPRDKRKERNDAVHMLHTIFPVENDHVTVFHKSVTDWLKLDVDKNPQFSVSVESGLKYLTEKSLEVLRVFKEREKPLDRPLALSNNEYYAAGFAWCHCSENAYNGIDDIFIFAATLWTAKANPSWFIKSLNDSSNFGSVLKLFRDTDVSDKLCFGHLLSVVGDLFLNCGLLSPFKEQLQHWLV